MLDQLGVVRVLDIFAHQFDVEEAVVAGFCQTSDDLFQRKLTFAQATSVLLAARRTLGVAQLDYRNQRDNLVDTLQDRLVLPQMVRVECKLRLRLGLGE